MFTASPPKNWIANSNNANVCAEAVIQPPKFTDHLVNAEANANAGAEAVAHICHLELAVATNDHGFSSNKWISNSANANTLAEAKVQPPKCHLVNAKAKADAVTEGVAHISHLAPAVAANVHSFSCRKNADCANVNSLAKAVVQPPKFIEHLVTVQVGRAGRCSVRKHKVGYT